MEDTIVTASNRTVAVFSAALLSGLLAAGQLSAAPLEISVLTNKSSYTPYDLLTVGVTAYNPNDSAVTLNFPTSEQAWYAMDGVYDNRGSSFQVLTSQTIPAYSSYTWSMNHDWSEYNLTLGTHSVVGSVAGFWGDALGSSQPYFFDVIPPTLPTSDVLIDFTHAPDGSVIPAGSNANVYAAWGVHMGTFKNGEIHDIGISSYQGNQYVAVYDTTYPPGFNILAEFDMPVYGVTADVSTAAGYSVTMVAKDANGQVIDSVTSDTVPALHDFMGPIELQSTTPIASVEWWPSYTNATVKVDNLFLSLSEPPLAGDINGDGFVGIEDFNFILANWNRILTPGEPQDIDPSADKFVGIEDLNIVLSNWNAGTPPPTHNANIPEPATIALLSLGFALTHRRR